MKAIKEYNVEIMFPDGDIDTEDLIQKILSDAPEFENCIINVNENESNAEKPLTHQEIQELVEKSTPCPSCNNRELHVFHVDKETLLDLDLPRECDTFDVDYLIFLCRACHRYFQNYKVKK